MTASPIEILADLPPDEVQAMLDGLDEDEIRYLLTAWEVQARPEQRAPDWLWRWWAMVTGRGFGKNRSGSEWVLDRCERFAAARHPHLIGLLNRSFDHVKKLQIGGESGLRVCAEMRGAKVEHASTGLAGRIGVWNEGWHWSEFEVHTAVEPDRVRGRNFHTVWGDEFAAWPQVEDSEGGTAFTNADLGLRALCPPGMSPQGMATSTPKAIKLVRDLLASEYGPTAVTRGSIYDNRSNLAPEFVDAIERRYLGSRLGSQELLGSLLDAVEGALWTRAGLDATRLHPSRDELPDMVRVVVGVDPPGSPSGAECGIIVAGWAWGPDPIRPDQFAPHLYILDDVSMQGASDEWALAVVGAAKLWNADKVVAERNYGGDMVRGVIQLTDSTVTVDVVTATRGKAVRAEPVSTLWSPQQQRGHIVGSFPDVEEQMCSWVQGDPISPDRMDAAVWCGHELIGDLTAIDATVAYAATDHRLD